MLDPQQELFIKLKTDIESLEYDVFDGALPPENTPYPFVYLDGFAQTDRILKNAVMGTVTPTIHVWHNSEKQRGTVSEMLLNIKRLCYSIDKTTSYSWLLDSLNQTIITDTTTRTPLLHGVLDLSFKFS